MPRIKMVNGWNLGIFQKFMKHFYGWNYKVSSEQYGFYIYNIRDVRIHDDALKLLSIPDLSYLSQIEQDFIQKTSSLYVIDVTYSK